MFSKTGISSIQKAGTLHEYEQHVRNGHLEKTKAIRAANPELAKEFDEADGRVTATL